MAAGRAPRSLGPGRRHRQRPGPPLPPPAAATQAHGAQPAGHGPAEGEFAAALRAGAAADLDAIYGLDFIRGLADGTLPEHEFAYYLAQDAIYLNGYSRVLARAAAIAPTEAEQLFWARSAQTLPGGRVRAAPFLAQHPPAAAAPGPGHEVLRGSPAGRLGVRQLRGARGGGPAVLLALRRGRVHPAPGVPGRAAPPGRTPTPSGCGRTPTRTSPPPPGRPSRTRTRRPGGLRRGAGGHGPGLPAVLRATKWTSSTRRGCTPDRDWPPQPVG